MIGKILDIIVENGLKGIRADEKFFGIAETVYVKNGSVIERMPGIVGADGEMVYAGIDDINSLMVYFKINSTTISLNRNGRGDKWGDYRNVFSVSAYVYWDRQKINLSIDQMIMLMQSRMPILVRGLQDLNTVSILLTGANTNTLQIYTQEYSSSEALKPLPANNHIVQLNFNIEITFNPECFRQCPECAVK